MSKRVGMIGLGVMGAPMARQLSAKCGNLVVFDVDANKTNLFRQLNIKTASSLSEVGEGADIVLLSLPNTSVVKNVILAEAGLINSMGSRGTIIDTSTTDPTVTKEIAGRLAEQEISFLDAPVSGGVLAAA